MKEGTDLALIKKKRRKMGIMCFIVGAVLTVILAIAGAGDATLLPIGIGAILMICYFSNLGITNRYCKKCGKKFDFDSEVEYWELETSVTSGDHPTYYATFDFSCHCSNCGHVHEFKKKFQKARTAVNGLKVNNLEKDIRKYFTEE